MSPTLIRDLLVEEFQKRSDPGAYLNWIRAIARGGEKYPGVRGYRAAARAIEKNKFLISRIFNGTGHARTHS